MPYIDPDLQAQADADRATVELLKDLAEWGLDHEIEEAISKALEALLGLSEFAAGTTAGVITGVFSTTETAGPELDELPSATPSPFPFPTPDPNLRRLR